ncbi:DUF916 and DUF3324 domain-containing protein [Carnobacterium sp.]|uniref:DUF916 and DUF3324 domain-containing protein n=1 Tax=Carnobacterium sp. TaxID=48221 RepID=UPI002FC773EA
MKKYLNLVAILTVVTMSFFSLGGIKADAAELNFAVTPTIPENQVDKTKTFFDLLMEPEKEQTVEVQLRNDTDKDVIVETQVNSATTNLNGVVEYGKTKVKQDSTLKYNLADLVEVDSEVTIPAQGGVTLPLKIKMPKESFSGILAGGISFKEKDTGEKQEADGEGIAIQNKYAYIVGIVLRVDPAEIQPDMLLTKVAPAQVNARNVVNANLQNPTAMFINQLKVSAQVTRQGSKDVLFSSKKENMQMAPNSNFDYPIALSGKKMEAGKYTVKLTAESKGEKWEFEKDFEIDADTAKKFNAQDVTIEEDNTWLYILIGVGLILLAIVLIFIIMYRRKKKKEAEARRKAANRKRRKRKAQSKPK